VHVIAEQHNVPVCEHFTNEMHKISFTLFAVYN